MRKKEKLTVESAEQMDLDGLGKEELDALESEAEALYELILQREPQDMESEEYAAWEDRLEILDDLMDEIQDRLSDE